MDYSLVTKTFGRYGIFLRPEGIKELHTLTSPYLDEKLIQSLAIYARDLQVEFLDDNHVRQIVEMHAQGQVPKKKNEAIDKIKDKIENTFIIMQPFESGRCDLLCSPQDKVRMYIDRLQHILQILKVDEKGYTFGISYDGSQRQITPLGNAISTRNRIYLVGLIYQSKTSYYISDGIISLKINITEEAKQNSHQQGLINQYSVVVANGYYDEQEQYFQITEMTVPIFDIRHILLDKHSKLDLKQLLLNDQFGLINNVSMNLDQLFQHSTAKQNASIFKMLSTKKHSIIFLANFDLSKLQTIQKFKQLIIQLSELGNVTHPYAIIFMGRFHSENNSYSKEFIQILKQHQQFINSIHLFFMPSFDDEPLPYSMPHTPIDLDYLLGEQFENMQSVSNPIKIGAQGCKIVVTRNDISKDLRKQHIFKEQSTYMDVAETIISQQYLGNFQSNTVNYKWNYNKYMMLDPTVEYVILADMTIEQFKHKTQINDTWVINPGNFSEKGEFCMFIKKLSGFQCDTCCLK